MGGGESQRIFFKMCTNETLKIPYIRIEKPSKSLLEVVISPCGSKISHLWPVPWYQSESVER